MWEKELLGIYVSGHPLDAHEKLLAKTKFPIKKIKEEPKNGNADHVAEYSSFSARTLLTKSGEKMAFLKLEDKTDSN